MAGSIDRFFKNDDNIKMLEKLQQLGISLKNNKKQVSLTDAFTGKSFLFTGTLTQFKRSDAETLVEANGGNIVGGVSSKLNYLVVGADAGSKLEKAKKIPSISILNEEDFLKMLPK